MTQAIDLKFSLSASLCLAGLCLVATVVGALWLYADSLSHSQLQSLVPSPNWQETISSSQDLLKLKANCEAIARSLDSSNSLIATQSGLLKKFMAAMGWFLVILGSVGSVVMFAIYFQIRRVVKAHAL